MESIFDVNPRQVEVIQSIKGKMPELLEGCYAVGSWIWAEFEEELSQEELEFLKELGFQWNPTRDLWQNACGVLTRRSSGDPRSKYPVIKMREN